MPKLILISHDVIGEKMAGPGIRYWEFAKALSSAHEVVLFSPNAPETSLHGVLWEQFTPKKLNQELRGAKAVLSQAFSFNTARLAKKEGARIILDAYAPELIEHLELFKHMPLREQSNRLDVTRRAFLFSMKIADFVLAAHERQKDLWMGVLAALGKIDAHFESRIGVVPFGISSNPPEKTGPGFREKLHLRAHDKLLLWGGGIWNWFDPLTLLHAMAILSQKRKDIHLLFMGMQHPHPKIPSMQMAKDALELAKSLNLKGKTVHFHFDWVPYNERQNVLLESDIGLSLHFDNLETRYSFRTRILDYLWTALPILCTQGDYFSELVTQQHLGISIPAKSPEACALAIEEILDNPEKVGQMKENLKKTSQAFTWEKVVEPLHHFLEQASPKMSFFSQVQLFKEFIQQKGLFNIIKNQLR